LEEERGAQNGRTNIVNPDAARSISGEAEEKGKAKSTCPGKKKRMRPFASCNTKKLRRREDVVRQAALPHYGERKERGKKRKRPVQIRGILDCGRGEKRRKQPSFSCRQKQGKVLGRTLNNFWEGKGERRILGVNGQQYRQLGL